MAFTTIRKLLSAGLVLFLTLLSQKHLVVDAVESNDVIQVEFTVNLAPGDTGTFVVEVHPDWAPIGAERFVELVGLRDVYWVGMRFFRVIPGFIAQFGIPGKPPIAAMWQNEQIKDDPVVESNKRGTIAFATSGPNARTTQFFINFQDNPNLDDMGFAPFGKVVQGMSVVDKLYSGYAEKPDEQSLFQKGNSYLKREFPNLSYIKSVQILDANIEAESGATDGEL
mmetsp:Transcript_24560/g.32079  ORF Transcript_24560/g.32079 Transcript_24560/m.32079 type:complete len:225 (+) Transcript_24560:54-728(+)